MVYAEPNRRSCIRKRRAEQICPAWVGCGGVGRHNKDVEIDEGSLIGFLKEDGLED